MSRGSRRSVPGYAWHLTHRCHGGEHLLGFGLDRNRYLHWLFEAKKRFGLTILNYMVTSNHVHLLVTDTGNHAISRSMQLIAGKTAQEYNARKCREGAFWEDRYHATAVQAGRHLAGCMLYMDCNMVRAGVVGHPSAWAQSGYHEIVNPPKRYTLVDLKKLAALLGMSSPKQLMEQYPRWTGDVPVLPQGERVPMWTESLAVGDGAFVEAVKRSLASRASGLKGCEREGGVPEIREPNISYGTLFDPEMPDPVCENTYCWDLPT